jgi:MoxR-like ATPase
VLYQFDHLGRLYDAQHQEAEKKPKEKYVTYHALGNAIRADSPKVVLIDEIDKAPRDFPNDLLHEIDQRSFSVNEVPELRPFQSTSPHAVVITSNSERQLPLPFLRRCTYFHIEYPDDKELRKIVLLHTGKLGAQEGLVKAAVQRFQELRALPGLVKRPATDELIAWTKVLVALNQSGAQVEGTPLRELPGLSAVLKSVEDKKRLPG